MPKISNFHYPFSAVIGQDKLKTALLLVACEPLLGGVLISGHRGTAKSTLARSLADLLDNKPFVNCPLGVSEDRLLGSLDIEHVLADGKMKLSSGLFAQAHGGVLYVDEINLLPDYLIDLLLDVSASGINYVERDGISHQHPAQFILIGSMNAEEGALRPQLLDRFGLSIEINDTPDLQQRLEIVESRLSFDNDPRAFCQHYVEAQNSLRQLIHEADKNLKQVSVSFEKKRDIAQYCLEAGVEGVRADLALYRAARAQSALRGANSVTKEDIDTVVDLVLDHRRQEPKSLAQPNIRSKDARPPNNKNDLQDNASSSQSKESNDSNQQSSQGDWGEMPVEEVSIGLSRQLDPTKFSQKNTLFEQKKKL